MRIIRIVGRVFYRLVVLAMLLILLCNIYIVAVREITGEKMPLVLGYSSALVVSGSMSGSIEVGDMVVVHKENTYSVGDVISFYSGDSVVTHRIVKKRLGVYTTKGDANNTVDVESAPEENVIGRVVLVIPKVGTMIDFLRTPLGGFFIVVLGVLLFFLPRIHEK